MSALQHRDRLHQVLHDDGRAYASRSILIDYSRLVTAALAIGMSRLILAVASIVLLLIDPLRAEQNSLDPPGRLLDVGGFRLHLHCVGAGSPAVILDAGLGGSANDWSKVQFLLAGTTRVCTYDRAGYGWSDSGPAPRTTSRIASELRTLLARAKLPPPYIVVGHSFGSYNMRLFSSFYPDDTAGLVLVDAPHEGQLSDFFQNQAIRAIDPQGLLPQLWRPELATVLSSVDLGAIAPLLGLKAKTLGAILGELAAFRESGSELSASSLDQSFPLVVIMHGRRVLPPGEWGDQLEQEWLRLQREMAASHPHGRFLIAERSAHLIPREQPELITREIQNIVRGFAYGEKLRAPDP